MQLPKPDHGEAPGGVTASGFASAVVEAGAAPAFAMPLTDFQAIFSPGTSSMT